MKRIILSVLALIFVNAFLAQSPEMFNYQSAVRNSSGDIVASQNVSFRISILQGSTNGSSVYTETHSVTTSNLGLVDFKIGDGTAVSGNFHGIDWGSNSYFVKIELDVNGGSNYSHMGTSMFVSVPYAMHARTADNVPENISELNNDAGFITSPNDADFDSSNEIQSLSVNGYDLTISSGNTISLPSSDSWIMDNDSAVYLGRTNEVQSGSDFSVVAGSNNSIDANYSFVSGMQNEVTGFMNMAVGFGDTIGDGSFTLYKYALGQNIKMLSSGGGSGNNSTAFGVGANIVTRPGSYMLGEDITNSVGLNNYALGRNVEFQTANAFVIGIGEDPADPIVATESRSLTVAFSPQSGVNNDPALFVGPNTSSSTGFVGIGTNSPSAKLTVENGDIYLPDATTGVILTSPNGSCYKLLVDNTGLLTPVGIACP